MKKQQPAKDLDDTLPFEATQAAAMMEMEPCSPPFVDLGSQESVATAEGSLATPLHAHGFCRSLSTEFSAAKSGGLTKLLVFSLTTGPFSSIRIH